jgi:hypothetical protein
MRTVVVCEYCGSRPQIGCQSACLNCGGRMVRKYVDQHGLLAGYFNQAQDAEATRRFLRSLEAR